MTWNKKLFFLLRNLAEYAERYLRRRIHTLEQRHPNSSSVSLCSILENEILREFDFPHSSLDDSLRNEEISTTSFQQLLFRYRQHPVRTLLRYLFLQKPHLPGLSQATLLERLEVFEQYQISWKELPEVLTRSKVGFNNYIFKHHLADGILANMKSKARQRSSR